MKQKINKKKQPKFSLAKHRLFFFQKTGMLRRLKLLLHYILR